MKEDKQQQHRGCRKHRCDTLDKNASCYSPQCSDCGYLPERLLGRTRIERFRHHRPEAREENRAQRNDVEIDHERPSPGRILEKEILGQMQERTRKESRRDYQGRAIASDKAGEEKDEDDRKRRRRYHRLGEI